MVTIRAGKGAVGLVIAGIAATVAIVMGGNALTSSYEGRVEGVIVDQWTERDCRSNSSRNGRRCDNDYKSEVRLPDGSYRTFERQSWYRQKEPGDVVILHKRRGGWLGNIYYDPQ